MLCLGIESSCDDTALAVVKNGRLIAQAISSQVDMHGVFGGVVPELASRAHLHFFPHLWKEIVTQIDVSKVQGIAVTRGPGLLGSLLVGMSFAKGLALSLDLPLVGVNHLHAHLLAAGLEQELLFPALGLLVSGGHTHLYRIDSCLQFTVLGRTLDDAAGEAYDKVAKLLNLPYPGGIFVDRFSAEGQPDTRLLPRPYLDNNNLDFSFSGLKTAVLNHVNSRPHLVLQSMLDGMNDFEPSQELADLCASFNWTVADTLRVKVQRALKRQQGIKALVLAGGVAANSRIRQVMAELASSAGLRAIMPSVGLCGDNAAMIAFAGQKLLQAGYCHQLDLEAIPRGRAVPEDYCKQVFSAA